MHSDSQRSDPITTARARVLALLRAHGAINLAADVETATDAAHLARIAQAALNDEAITADHAALLGLLALATAAPPPPVGRGLHHALIIFVDRAERLTDTGPRLALASDEILATFVIQQGGPEFARRSDGHPVDAAPAQSARVYLEAALDAGAIIVPDGHRVIVEGEDDEDGSWLRLSVEPAPGRPQLSWDWGKVDDIPTSDEEAPPIDALRDLLVWLIDDVNGLLTSV